MRKNASTVVNISDSFVWAYALVFVDPAAAGLVGWPVGMVTRRSGHLFFEPRGFDRVHQVSYAQKESFKVGCNMRRKALLIACGSRCRCSCWRARRYSEPARGFAGFVHDVGLAWPGLAWLALGASGPLLRTVHLFFLRSPAWGLAWAAKILRDPFHNIASYWRSPFALLRGEWFDPLDLEPHERGA